MSIKVIVNSTSPSRVSVNNSKRESVRTVGIAPNLNPNNLSDLEDVDMSDADNNETLVYDEASGKFIVRELPIINGGEF
jgi:hypothetical protein